MQGLLVVGFLPFRLAQAMGRRGWMLADHVVWAKSSIEADGTRFGTHMPESVPSRLNDNAHETLLRFTRSKHAWIDLSAIGARRAGQEPSGIRRYLPEALMATECDVRGRRRANVWKLHVAKSRLPHSAMFPPALVEVPVAATAPMWVCQTCGQARTRGRGGRCCGLRRGSIRGH